MTVDVETISRMIKMNAGVFKAFFLSWSNQCVYLSHAKLQPVVVSDVIIFSTAIFAIWTTFVSQMFRILVLLYPPLILNSSAKSLLKSCDFLSSSKSTSNPDQWSLLLKRYKALRHISNTVNKTFGMVLLLISIDYIIWLTTDLENGFISPFWYYRLTNSLLIVMSGLPLIMYSEFTRKVSIDPLNN